MATGLKKEHELHTRRRGRNVGVLGLLVALAVLLFAVTMVKMGPQSGNPTAGASWGETLLNWARE
ncbi:MAG: hypothetical protein AAFV19_15880 [Pseudomonadota bacterium]